MRTLVVGLVLLAVVVAWAQSQETIAARGDAAFRSNGWARWLRDPALQRPTAHMPALELSEEDVSALAVYLSTLR
jgi:hypothetical protein